MILKSLGLPSALSLGLIFVALSFTPIARSSESDDLSQPTHQFIQVGIAEAISEEFSKPILDQNLKDYLIRSAAASDRQEIIRLLAARNRSSDIRVSSSGPLLKISDKSGRIIADVHPPAFDADDFLINGRKWTPPQSGSILKELTKHLSEKPRSTTPKGAGAWYRILELATAKAFAAREQDHLLPLYHFVESTKKSRILSLKNLMQRGGVDDHLSFGAHFSDTNVVDYYKAYYKYLTMARHDVQCTPQGAKGRAEISGTRVEFIARRDGSLMVRSDKSSQWLLFEPENVNFSYKSNWMKQLGAKLMSNSNDEMAEMYYRTGVSPYIDIEKKVREVCEIAAELPLKTAPMTACRELVRSTDRFWEKDSQPRPGYLSMRHRNNSEAQSQAPQHAQLVKNWWQTNRDAFMAMAESVQKVPVLRERFAELRACKNSECAEFFDQNNFESYRLPPNDTETAVDMALRFKPSAGAQRSSSSAAKIEYNCPSQNSACQSVRLVGGESLTGADVSIANELVDNANRALRWKPTDASVVQPVAKLRLLGPCCDDSQCRRIAFEKGVNLKATEDKGTAK